MSNHTSIATRQRYFDVPAAAEYVGVSEKTIRRMIAAGDLLGYRLGSRMIRVNVHDLDAMLKPIPSARTRGGASVVSAK